MPDREDAFVSAMLNDYSPEQVRSVISYLRTLGYINEVTYSAMNTALSKRSFTVRSDGSETIELARDHNRTIPT